MKLERLELTAFGKFSGETLEFGDPSGGLHVVYGDNEAGKSTALRAIRAALFGVPVQSTDTFVHAPKDIRVGFEVSEGAERCAFVRRKGRTNTLLSPTGEALDEGQLTRFLHGVDQTLFDSMFGLNHESLRKGAEALLALEGKLGATLFEAGFGTAHLRSLLATFREQADDIFTSRGRSKRLNVEVAKVRKARETLASSATLPQTYLELRRQHEENRAALAELKDARQALSKRKAVAELRLRLLPLVAQWRAYGEQHEALGDLPQLPLDAEQQVQTLLRRTSEAEVQRDQAVREVARVERELEQLVVDDALFDVAQGEMDELAERLGSARKARADLPGLQARHATLADQIRRQLRYLGYPADLALVDGYRLTRDEETQVRRLIRERTQYDTKLADLAAKQKQLEASVSSLKKDSAKAAPETNLRPLEAALVRAQKYADLEQQLDAAKLELETLERRWSAACDELRPSLHASWKSSSAAAFTGEALWGGGAAVTLALVNEYAAQFDSLQRQLAAFREETFALRERVVELSHQVAVMERDEAVPTEAGLAVLKRTRDAAFEALEQRILPSEGKAKPRRPPAEDTREKEAADRELLDTLRRTIQTCDDYAERLRRDADRVAELRSRQAALAELRERLTLREEREKILGQEHADLQQRWGEVWRGSAFIVGTPNQMTNVLARVAEVRQLEVARNDVFNRVRKLERELATVVAELSSEMVQVGEQGRTLWETLGQFVNRLESVLQGRREQNAARRELIQRLEIESERLEQAQRAMTELKETGRALRSEWPKVTKRLGLSKDAGPEELDSAANGLTELFRSVDDAQALQRRIAGIERDAEALAADIRKITLRVRGETPEGDGIQALEQLLAAHRRQVVAAQERERLRRELTERRRTLERAVSQLEEAQKALERWFHRAGVMDVESLVSVIGKVARSAELERLRLEEERRIIAHGEGRGLAELLTLCDGQESEELQTELGRIQEELAGSEKRWEELTQLALASEQRLNHLGEGAARSAEELESEVASLQATVRRYLRYQLATLILEREIERYREKNQGPVLGRARTVFPRLTLGRYDGLQVGYAADDQPILLCVTKDGREVGVEGLSDGTRDQLYLSLRLATLEQYFHTNPRMPWILDDVLVHFDDERATAALEVLAEFARDNQVLFFTHHARTVELAKQRLDSGSVAFHVLGGANLG